MKSRHQELRSMKGRQLTKQYGITRHRRRIVFALFAFSSLMAVTTLIGFTHMLHKLHDLDPSASLRDLDVSIDPLVVVVPIIDTIDLHSFSDQEADANADKIKEIREEYHSRCLCNTNDCELIDKHQWMLPGVTDSLLHSISNSTKTAGHEKDTEVIDLLDDDAFWQNESRISKCPYVIMDLGSNRGDTLQSFLNVLLSSIHSPSTLSPLHHDLHSSDSRCTNKTKTKQQQTLGTTLSYQFDLESLSIKERPTAELSKRHDRIHKHHQLDMESYLDLHMGCVESDGDPWMEFQLKEKMMDQQKQHYQQHQDNGGDDHQASYNEMRKIYEEEQRRKSSHNQEENNNHRPRPEQYCFYGVEGNPAFTRKLRGLELMTMYIGGKGKVGSENKNREQNQLKGTDPSWPSTIFKGLHLLSIRPLRHVHFFTETVVTSRNGPTELYLDSVSTNQVGSSLLESHKYAVLGGKDKVAVQGVTLTSILERVLSGFIKNNESELPPPFAPPILLKPGEKTTRTTTDIDKMNNSGGGGHLILKIDIEGGEYGVLREVLESGKLCGYAKRGGSHRVDLVVEFHKWVIEDKKQKEEFAKLERMFYKELSSCGIHLTKMDTTWH